MKQREILQLSEFLSLYEDRILTKHTRNVPTMENYSSFNKEIKDNTVDVWVHMKTLNVLVPVRNTIGISRDGYLDVKAIYTLKGE
jgi:hypothetical protein